MTETRADFKKGRRSRVGLVIPRPPISDVWENMQPKERLYVAEIVDPQYSKLNYCVIMLDNKKKLILRDGEYDEVAYV